MKQFTVTGMSCAACSARVEKAVSKISGVESVSVSLLTNSMGVEGDFSDGDIIKAVEAAGYGARLKDGAQEGGNGGQNAARKGSSYSAQEEALADYETPVLKKRLIASVIILLFLMYFSMGHMMWGWPVPPFFEGNHVAMGILELVLSAAVMVINQKFFISGVRAVFHGAPNMDTLVAMGSGVSFLYSLWALFKMTEAMGSGGMEAAAEYMDEMYFETAAMIVTLITVGKMLESISKGRTTDALKSLMRLAPETAVLERDGKEVTVPVSQVRVGDVFLVRPGESIPVDGNVIEGSSAVNEAALTGESIPVDKAPEDVVSAGTINQSGFLRCRASRVGEDTSLSKIIRLVSDAAATKAPIAKIADKVSGIFVPAVIGIAIITFIVWMIIGVGAGKALYHAIAVLVISCPCSLGLATPVAIMVGSGKGARNGILFKTAASLEALGKSKIVVLDKTGTITRGEPQVTDIIPEKAAGGAGENELLALAYSLEVKSEHPLAKAIVLAAEELNLKAEDVSDFEALPGNGLSGKIKRDGKQTRLAGGNYAFISTVCEVPDPAKNKADEFASQGKTPLFFSEDGRFSGIIAVADVIKEDSAQAIKELENQGLYVVMLTGDNERTARAIGSQAGVNEIAAGVLPDGKEAVIRRLKKHGSVVMTGDGINDAPALASADTGIAIGAGADVALDAADVVLVKSSLKDAAAAVRLSRATLRNIHENLFWAFFYNAIGIPLAAGVFIGITGWSLNPMIGAAAMALSSFCVVTNALRLNLFKINDTKRDRKIKGAVKGPLLSDEPPKEGASGARGVCECGAADNAALCENKNIPKEKESCIMEKTIRIEGMMCGHCEATVKKALEAVDGVKEAAVSHEKGEALVTFSSDVSDDILKEAVESHDYKVLEIK